MIGLDSPLTQHLLPEETERLLAAMTEVRVPAGTELIAAGKPNDALYLLLEGELVVSLPTAQGPLIVGGRSAGSWVGEVTVVEPGLASAAVTAARECRLKVLRAAQLRAWVDDDPALAAKVLRAIGDDLARRVRHAGAVLEAVPASEQGRGFFGSLFTRLFGGPVRA